MKTIFAVIITIIVVILLIYVIWWFSIHTPTSQKFRPVERNYRIVVTFSTIPSRMEYIPEMIKQLENQTLIPDAIYFNLPYRSKRENKEYIYF